MQVYKIEGVIIKRSDYGEADKIVTIFAKNHGKIKAIAKGIRKIKSRRAPHIELFNYAKISLHRGQNLDIITEAEAINTYNILKQDLKKVSVVYYLSEVIDKLCPEKQEHDDVFKEFLISLKHLNTENPVEIDEVINNFSSMILIKLGFLPSSSPIHLSKLHSAIEDIIEKKLKTTDLLTRVRD